MASMFSWNSIATLHAGDKIISRRTFQTHADIFGIFA
jgi:hypothetical protein